MGYAALHIVTAAEWPDLVAEPEAAWVLTLLSYDGPRHPDATLAGQAAAAALRVMGGAHDGWMGAVEALDAARERTDGPGLRLVHGGQRKPTKDG